MRKKIKVLVLLMVFVTFFVNAQDKAKQKEDEYKSVKGEYQLKNANAREIIHVIKMRALRATYNQASNHIVYEIYAKDKKAFIELLKKIDVPSVNYRLKVFAIKASKNKMECEEEIKNKQILEVLDELKSIFSFKYFCLDSISMSSFSNSTKEITLKLIGKDSFVIYMRKFFIGKDKIDSNFILHTLKMNKEGQNYQSSLINSSISMAKNGYLVAGMARTDKNKDDAIIIVLKNEIIK